ncbi:MAG: hypothetical protein RIR16_335 [Actinomycetota bacterium]
MESKYPDSNLSQVGLFRRLGAITIDWVISLIFSGAFFENDSTVTLVFFSLMRVVLIATNSATIGQRLLGIRVVRLGVPIVGFRSALVRTALELLVLPALINTEAGTPLHDQLAKTRLVLRK